MSFLFDLYRTLRFATRLPLPVTQAEEADPIVPADRFAVAFATCGVIVGGCAASVFALAILVGASTLIASLLAVACAVAITGALHEDGLADCADGFGGGRSRARKLEIMRDSSVGTYALVTLVLSLGLRTAALTTLGSISVPLTVAAVVAAHTLSRACAMGVAASLPLARADGASASLGKPTKGAAALSLALAFAVVMLALWFGAGLQGLILAPLATAAAAVGAFWFGRLSQNQIGGQTGDVLGATQQVSHLAVLLVLSISTGWIV